MKTFLILFLLFHPTLAKALAPNEDARLEQGVLDLTAWAADRDPSLPIRGTVEFHWQHFLQPGEQHPESLTWSKFPGYWNLVDHFPIHGYASYRFLIKLRDRDPLSLRFVAPWTAARYYVEGRLVHSIGEPGTTAETSRAGQLRPYIYSFTPASNEVEVIVHVANFDLFGGGMGNGIEIGTVPGITNLHERIVARGLFLMGAIVIMGIYHIALFWLRRTDLSTLYYGIFCLTIAIHLSVAELSNPFSIMFKASFTTQIRLYNFGWMLGTPAFILFSQQLFQREIKRRIPLIIAAISIIHVAVIMMTSVRAFILSTMYYQLVTGLGAVYTIYAVIRAARQGREGARIFLLASFALVVCTLHDMLVLRGLFTSPPLGALGALLFTFGQSFLLSQRFAHAYHRAETSEAEVRHLVHTLEERVEEQTRDIHSIMEHIPLGIFTIEGERQTIHKDYSAHLERLLEADQLTGKAALPLLFQGSTLAADERDQVFSTLSAAIGQSEINFFTNEHMLPKSMARQRQDGQLRQLDLSWKPILKDDDEVDKVLVTVNDATEMRKLESMAREKADELRIIGEILSCKEDAFRRFLRNCREFNAQNRQLIAAADPNRCDRETLKIIFMNMHTMKGAARTLQFKKLTEIFHDLEQYYSNLAKQDEARWDLGLMQRDVEMIDRVAEHYETLAREKLGRSLGEGSQVHLPFESSLEGFQQLDRLFETASPPAALLPLHGLLQAALFNSMQQVLADILSSTVALAKDLNKPTPRLEIQTPDLWVSHRAEDLLRNTFVHLLRNSMDHGIEDPSERQTRGKMAEGLVRLHVETDANTLRIMLSDDGRGLHLARLLTLGRSKNLLARSGEVPRDQIAEVIFAAGISTAQAVTDISGRGVGMSAVRQYYAEAGGTISVQFDENRLAEEGYAAFQFCICLPLHFFSQSRSYIAVRTRSVS